MSLVPKIVEVQEFVLRNQIDIAIITETWLKGTICDSVVKIPRFTIFRKDGEVLEHGGFVSTLNPHS